MSQIRLSRRDVRIPDAARSAQLSKSHYIFTVDSAGRFTRAQLNLPCNDARPLPLRSPRRACHLPRAVSVTRRRVPEFVRRTASGTRTEASRVSHRAGAARDESTRSRAPDAAMGERFRRCPSSASLRIATSSTRCRRALGQDRVITMAIWRSRWRSRRSPSRSARSRCGDPGTPGSKRARARSISDQGRDQPALPLGTGADCAGSQKKRPAEIFRGRAEGEMPPPSPPCGAADTKVARPLALQAPSIEPRGGPRRRDAQTRAHAGAHHAIVGSARSSRTRCIRTRADMGRRRREADGRTAGTGGEQRG